MKAKLCPQVYSDSSDTMTYLYRKSELILRIASGELFRLGIILNSEFDSLSMRECFKLIALRLSFCQQQNIKLPTDHKIAECLNLERMESGQPVVKMNDCLRKIDEHIMSKNIMTSFSYEGPFILCGLVITI